MDSNSADAAEMEMDGEIDHPHDHHQHEHHHEHEHDEHDCDHDHAQQHQSQGNERYKIMNIPASIIQEAKSPTNVIEFDDACEEIDLSNLHLTVQPDFVTCERLQFLSLRCNLLTSFQLLMNKDSTNSNADSIPDPNSLPINTTLTELDLYENRIEKLQLCKFPVALKHLDLSFNVVRQVQGLDYLSQLKKLYLSNNKISWINGLDALSQLELLELGSNRIRLIENLDKLTNLRELWLGRNKITEISNISHLQNLRVLSLQSNRLTSLGDGFTQLSSSVEELYLSHNGLTSMKGLRSLIHLQLLDLGNNQIRSIEELDDMHELNELWMNGNCIESWSEVDKLRGLKSLTCVYMEENPFIQSEPDPEEYRSKLKTILPGLTQIDAEECSS